MKQPKNPIGIMMIRILTIIRDTLAITMMKATSMGRTPIKDGRERRRKIMPPVSKIEVSQHWKACSNPSSRSEASMEMINMANKNSGPRVLMRIKKPI
jgi:hypothetical protein